MGCVYSFVKVLPNIIFISLSVVLLLSSGQIWLYHVHSQRCFSSFEYMVEQDAVLLWVEWASVFQSYQDYPMPTSDNGITRNATDAGVEWRENDLNIICILLFILHIYKMNWLPYQIYFVETILSSALELIPLTVRKSVEITFRNSGRFTNHSQPRKR